MALRLTDTTFNMLLMQYRFDFPDDHDMASVRERIAVLGPGFHSLPGLMQKAFFVSSRADNRPNRYAPFYAWHNEEGMRSFLLSEAFARLCAKYGRPEVRTWMAVYSNIADASRIPVLATQQLIAIDPSTDLAALAERERASAESAADDDALHSIHVGLDTVNWQLLRTCFWHRLPADARGLDVYDIEYLAFPHQRSPEP